MDGKWWPDSCLGLDGNGLGLSRSLSLKKMQFAIVRRQLRGRLCAQSLMLLEAVCRYQFPKPLTTPGYMAHSTGCVGYHTSEVYS